MLAGRLRMGLTAAAAAAGLAAFGAGLALLSWDVQLTLIVVGVTVLAAMWLIPRAVQKEPTVTVALLSVALAAKIVGAFARYTVLQVVYGGVADAVGYHAQGSLYAPMVRALDFSFLDFSTLGTPIVGYFAAFVYAFTTPSMLTGFLVFSMLSFIGLWCFYRAHRISFPDGNHRLYFLLLFFLPTLVYWPSALGKDALVVFGLGVATLGLARIFHRPS
ncbi:MAG: hypothetical protein ABR518_03825, partial [Actinomycetota bacterium]